MAQHAIAFCFLYRRATVGAGLAPAHAGDRLAPAYAGDRLPPAYAGDRLAPAHAGDRKGRPYHCMSDGARR